jgi:hypothetical protein
VDPESGLYHEEHFERSLAYEIARALESEKPLGLLLLSQVGGAALPWAGLGAFLGRELRRIDVPARLSGGELAVILPRVGIPRLAKLVEGLEREFPAGGPGPGLSYGFVLCRPTGSEDPAWLLREARGFSGGAPGLLAALRERVGKIAGSRLLAEERETLFKGFSTLCGKDGQGDG